MSFRSFWYFSAFVHVPNSRNALFPQKQKTAASPTPLGNGGGGGGVLNTVPGGGIQIPLNDGGVIFARRGNNDADLKTHTGNVYKYRKRIQIPETYTNTVFSTCLWGFFYVHMGFFLHPKGFFRGFTRLASGPLSSALLMLLDFFELKSEILGAEADSES